MSDITTSCYRHPDRETGVSCQRCERFICYECSTPGAVGFLCPEDSKDRVKIQKANFQKSALSATPLTFTLIGINVVVYLLQQIFPNLIEFLLYSNVGSSSEYGSIIRVFTSAFAHSNSQITHIAFNMLSLYILGSQIEPILGRWRFLTLYFFSILGGGLGYLMLATEFGYVVGASGAVFGLMGAYLVFLIVLKLNTSQMFLIIGINLVLGFLPGIAWQAHVGGLIVGAATGYVFVAARKNVRRAREILSLVGITVGLAVLWFIANAPVNALYN